MQLQERSDELQKQQAELQRSNAELEEKAALLALSSQYKTEFLANMSHELRTPLNSLLILARLLADNTDDNLTGQQIEFARTIHQSGTELLGLINDILDLSKVEAGKMDVQATVVQTETLVDTVAQAVRPVAEEKGLAFRVTVDPGVPAEFVTDEQRILQVLRNLLSNALKFTDTGG